MPVSRKLRMILTFLALFALVAVGVMAVQHGTAPEPIAQSVEGTACSGDCANCPLAGSESCHRGDPGEAEAGSQATVDQERCIGCVRCVNVAPEAFEMDPETGKARVIEGAPAESIEHGARACPVDAVNG